jgi:hypothetical protein
MAFFYYIWEDGTPEEFHTEDQKFFEAVSRAQVATAKQNAGFISDDEMKKILKKFSKVERVRMSRPDGLGTPPRAVQAGPASADPAVPGLSNLPAGVPTHPVARSTPAGSGEDRSVS